MIPVSVHNTFLGITVELGIVGLIIYMYIIIYTTKKMFIHIKYSFEKNIAKLYLYSITVLLMFLFVLANTEYSKVLVFLISNIMLYSKTCLPLLKIGIKKTFEKSTSTASFLN